jgi:hypothetical protein
VRRWIRSGKLEGQKAGAQWRFDHDSVEESFEQGMLSGGSGQVSSLLEVKQRELREDERLQIIRWKEVVVDYLERMRPSHVVAVDRRGAKLWDVMRIEGYRWGGNLWHSTVIDLMPPKEQSRLFNQKTVLLFDDLLERGKTIGDLRNRFESVGANVLGLVCVRNVSSLDRGKQIETEAYSCEDVDERSFSERVTLISHLVSIFEPPLDVDHLIVKAKLASGLTVENILDRLPKWGQAFIVWHPKEKEEYLAVTLDRPQFLNIDSINVPKGFSVGWAAPCKVRFYILPEDGTCYCSFIAYPEIEASEDAWAQEIARSQKETQLTLVDSPYDLGSTEGEALVRAAYWRLCMDFTMKLFDAFVTSGAAEEIGIRLENSADAVDARHLRAAFGPTIGNEIAKNARGILGRARFKERLSSEMPKNRIPLWIREYSEIQGRSYDVFNCRVDLLKVVPQRQDSTDPATKHMTTISYSEIFTKLPEYAESTIGKVLDNELEKATVKPIVQVIPRSVRGITYTRVSRGFMRGEFGIWFELNADNQSYDDKALQRALTLGAIVVEDYLKKTGKKDMTATEFNKIFANIQHDWRPAYDFLYLGWKPYKFGPIPIIPEVSDSGQYLLYHRFLVDKEILSKTEEQHESKTWSRFKPNAESKIPWRKLYEKRTTAETRAYLRQLIRVYAKIQQDFRTERVSDPRSSGISALRDSLVVLATARNEKTAYTCCWFEFDDWKRKGKALFPYLEGAVLQASHASEPYMKKYLDEFAAPAGILFDKIEMYRNIPRLRRQIESLVDQEGFEVAEVLLERVDASPQFASNSKYPIRNLEYACGVMRAFSSMTRQILTKCGLDADERKVADRLNTDGSTRDEQFYWKELLQLCPQLKAIEADLEACIELADKGVLTESIHSCLARIYQFVLSLFEKQKLIPDPRPSFEINRQLRQRQEGLNIRLQQIQISGPYAVSVVDIDNMMHFTELANLFGITYDEAFDAVLKWVVAAADEAAKRHNGVALCGLPADNVVIAAPDPNDVYLACLDFQTGTQNYVSEREERLTHLSLLQTGIAWHDDSLGEEFTGLKPGKIAYEMAGGRPSGTISITKAVYDRLFPLHQRAFTGNCGSCGQGEVFVRECRGT